MEIFYCDTCGKRASAEDKQSSLALSPDRIFCKECIAKQAQTKTEPVVKSISGSSTPVPRRTPKPDTTTRTATRPKEREEAAPKPKNNLPVILIGSMLAIFALSLVILSSSGGSKKPTTTTTASNSSGTNTTNPTPSNVTSTPIKNPVAEPVKTVATATGAEKTVPIVQTRETKTQELSPKEIYEQKVREGKINPEKAPDLPAAQGNKVNLLAVTTPPADDPSWKKLFNGKDMTGWDAPKGTWSVADGLMRCVPDAERGGSILSQVEYEDFEFIVKFKCSFQAEWYVRSDASFYLDLRDNTDWRIFRAVAKGRDVHASLDGKPLAPMISGLTKSSINAFVHQASKEYQIEEIKIRTLKPDEGAPPAPAPAPAGAEKELFNGKDLTGWQQVKGTWGVDNGALIPTSATGASRLQTEADYGNFELTFKVKVEQGHHVEVQLLSYTWYAELTRAIASDYKECKVVAQDAVVTVTLDGQNLQMSSEAKDKSATSGQIGFYAPNGVKCSIKDLKLKPLK